MRLRLRPWPVWIAEQFPTFDRTRVWVEMTAVDAVRWSAFWMAYAMRMGAVVSLAMAAWRFGVDISFTRNFLIREGIWSHWQVWLASSIAIGLMAAQMRIWSERPRTAVAPNNTEDAPSVVWHSEVGQAQLAQPIAD